MTRWCILSGRLSPQTPPPADEDYTLQNTHCYAHTCVQSTTHTHRPFKRDSHSQHERKAYAQSIVFVCLMLPSLLPLFVYLVMLLL